MEEIKGIGQKSIKGGTNDCFIFDSFFASNNTAEASMEVCAELIGTVKTNTKGFCKDTIDKITKDQPRGSYLVLRIKPMVSGDIPHISIGYRYNAQKFLSFIVTDNVGSTKTGITYYLSILTNLPMLPFALLLVPFLCQKKLLLMRLNIITNQDILIWHWRSGELLSVIGCGYVQHLLWE